MDDTDEIKPVMVPNEEALAEIRQGYKDKVYREDHDRPRDGEGEDSRPVDGIRQTKHSQATVRAYNKRAKQLMTRYLRERGLEGDFDPEDIPLSDMANWAISLKPSLRSSTWRIYRQSLLYMLSHIQSSEEVDDAIGILENDIYHRMKDGGRLYSAKETKKESDSTSSLKMKRVVYADYLLILKALRNKWRSSRCITVQKWIRAGLLTGLRPAEWAATDVVHIIDNESGVEKIYLLVINAKATNGRGNGIVRTIDITDFPEKDRYVISDMSKLGRQWFRNGDFDYEKRECGRLLHNVSRELWPKRKNHYSLYSFRHQAISNWKNRMDQYAVAALAGHGVIGTAGRSYARRSTGWTLGQFATTPKAAPDEVQNIVRRHEYQQGRVLDGKTIEFERDMSGPVPN